MIRLPRMAFIALAGLILGGCASAPPADAPASVKAVADSRGIQRVSVIAGNYYFQPNCGFICKEKLLFFASHLERGMQGTLEVVP